MSIGKAAKMLGVGVGALRKWEENGLLTPERTPTGHRRYRVAGLQTLMHEKDESPSFTCAIYARMSTKKQEDAGNLDRQTGRLNAYSFSARIYGKRGGKKLVEVVRSTLQEPMTGGESE